MDIASVIIFFWLQPCKAYYYYYDDDDDDNDDDDDDDDDDDEDDYYYYIMYLKCLHASKALLHTCFCSYFANLHL